MEGREALLSAIGRSTPDLVFAKDARGRMLYANPPTLALIGLPAEAVLGRTDLDWLRDAAQAGTVMENDRRVMARGEPERMQAQPARNFLFFDAPVGLIFTIDRRLEIGSWLDYGIFLSNVMTAVRGHGLHSCAQAAFAPMHEIVRRHLPIPPEEVVVCGMSIGHEDASAPENRLRTERVPARDFARFFGW